MTYVITQGCCNDGACARVCPVQCIRPRPGDPDFTHTEQLYIDPNSCIDCGACQDECPVDAVHPGWNLPPGTGEFPAINAEYFQSHPLVGLSVPSAVHRLLPPGHSSLRVAVVGSGAAGCYAVEALSEMAGVSVSLLDRLPVPFGLIRAGVAPDHQNTKKITERFARSLERDNVDCFFHVEVGKDITVAELLETHHAVIWAAGASADRLLGIPGENGSNVISARELMAWYNGHPDFADLPIALGGSRAVVLGNGNVALDVARSLLLPTAALQRTDMSSAAVAKLSASAIDEVVVVGRRGPEHAAFSLGELMSLENADGIRISAEGDEVPTSLDSDRRHTILRRAIDEGAAEGKVVRFRFGLVPTAVWGDGDARFVSFRREDGSAEVIEAGLVVRAIGFRGVPVDGLPFDPTTSTLTNESGRVVSPEDDEPLLGVYCAGWIKRGARGTIGTNRVDAHETVDAILQDLEGGRLHAPSLQPDELTARLAQRQINVVDKAGWLRINATEHARGSAEGRPLGKLRTVAEMLEAARADGV